MHPISLREFIPWDPSTDSTVLYGYTFNTSFLELNNYQQYSNGTISNDTSCILLFPPYTPTLLPNGTFINATSCYFSTQPIKARGTIGLVLASFFAVNIMFTLINLRKHGRLFLPTEKRFRAVGRRWQWYWMLAVSGCAMVSMITGIDVDRYYMPELPIVLSNFFFFLPLPMVMAVVWESVRHWGSWQERQLIDPNPFVLKQDDKRAKTEFWIPLVFYFFAWLNFFMIIPRNWSTLELQRSVAQQDEYARPSATEGRFKAGAFCLLCAWFVIVYSLWHSIKHYKPHNRGVFSQIIAVLRYAPKRLLLNILLAIVLVGYAAALSWNFDISPMKLDIDGSNNNAHLGYMYGLGWGPIVAIFLVQQVCGYLLPNEDRKLINQRRIRGAAIDAEMGLVKKPHWWSRLNGDHNLNVHEAIAKNVREVGGGAATHRNIDKAIELGNMPVSKAAKNREDRLGKGQTPEAVRMGAALLFPNASAMSERSDPFTDVSSADLLKERGRMEKPTSTGAAVSARSNSTESMGTLNQPPQVIKSMLDI